MMITKQHRHCCWFNFRDVGQRPDEGIREQSNWQQWRFITVFCEGLLPKYITEDQMVFRDN